jgi:SAM-dependent methyltransferase
LSIRVSHERWQSAQDWELEYWQQAQKKGGWRRALWPLARRVFRVAGSERGAGDDWNQWWASHFHDYHFLPQDIGNFIELGCGPYTNARLIRRHRRIQRTICSDPLIWQYLEFKGRWLAEAYRSKKIIVDDNPIESCPFRPDTFDVVVMINVLDHVRDADTCLAVATGLVRPGGYLVLGQDLTDESDLDYLATDEGRPITLGHPIRLSLEDLETHLHHFEPVHRRVLAREEGRAPEAHYATLVYAGRRSST